MAEALSDGTMRLRIIVPGEVLVDGPVSRIVAEAPNGSFGLLPRHVDFVTALVPGIIMFTEASGRERFVGCDVGTLVKVEDDVLVSTRAAVANDDLAALHGLVERRFLRLDHHERAARSALARLEAGIARRFLELQER